MKRRSVCLALSLALLVIDAGQADLASASQSASAINDAPISVSTAKWSVIAGAYETSTSTSSYVVSAFSAVTGCQTNKQTLGSTPTGSSTIKFTVASGVTGLTIGMTVSGNSRIVTGTTITAIDVATQTITLSAPTSGGSISNSSTIQFAGCFHKFFSINNIGNIDVATIGISQTVTTSGNNRITLQSCSGTWTTTTGACSGTVTQLILTNSGTGSVSQAPLSLLGQNAGVTDTARIRALSTTNSGSPTSTVSISINNALNLRSDMNTMS